MPNFAIKIVGKNHILIPTIAVVSRNAFIAKGKD